MRRGPPPTPTRLKLIKGNPGRRPLNKREPDPKVDVPDCPKHLSPLAAEEWLRITAELYRMGLLTQLDRAALAAYCQAWGRWVEAETMIEKHGLVVRSPNGTLMQTPMLAIANRAMKQMREFLTEFGMTPSSRSRVSSGTPPGADEGNAFAKLRSG